MLLAFERRLRFWFVLNSYLSERIHKYDGYEVVWTSDKIPRIYLRIYEKMLPFDFSNFICIISLYIFILKFVQIPWPDVHMNNLEECFCHFLKKTSFYCIRTPVSKNSVNRNKTWLNICAWFQSTLLRKIYCKELRSSIKQGIRL